MTVARIEKNGQVGYTDGKTTLVVPSEAACKESLVRLFESVGGDQFNDKVAQFWRDRAREMGVLDPLKAAWATECFKRLDKIWDEMTAPPVVQDAFASFTESNDDGQDELEDSYR